MAENRRILAHVLIEMNPLAGQGAEATKAALRSAIQVGLNAQVLELDVYPIAVEDGAHHVKAQIPHSEPSDRDQVVEEYMHSGMQVQIYREAGQRSPPGYFAVVLTRMRRIPAERFSTRSHTPNSSNLPKHEPNARRFCCKGRREGIEGYRPTPTLVQSARRLGMC